MAKQNQENKFTFKVKQICLTGLYLRMFEYDCEQQGLDASKVGREIIKEYYKQKPPLGFFKSKD